MDGRPLGVRLDTEAPAGPGGMLSRTHCGWGYHELSGRDGVLKPNVSQARVHRAPKPKKGARAGPDARFKSDETANQGESQFGNQGHGQIQMQSGKKARAQGQPKAARQFGLFPDGGGWSFL